jgi:hypothetical protein
MIKTIKLPHTEALSRLGEPLVQTGRRAPRGREQWHCQPREKRCAAPSAPLGSFDLASAGGKHGIGSAGLELVKLQYMRRRNVPGYAVWAYVGVQDF